MKLCILHIVSRIVLIAYLESFHVPILHTILSKLLPVAQSEDGSHAYLPSENSQVRSSDSSISYDRLLTVKKRLGKMEDWIG